MDALTFTNYSDLGLIVLLPLIGALINGIFGSKLPKMVVDFVAVGVVFISFALSVAAVMTLWGNPEAGSLTYTAYKWIYAGGFTADIAFLLDPLSAVMVLVVTGVGFLIHLYSAGYMADDEGKWKYFTYLNLFLCSMLLLILGKNMLVTFIGWEGVGACSYLLIGFWYTDPEKAQAGQKAFIINRIGDFAFLLGLFLLYSETGTLDYVELDAMASSAATVGKLAPIALPTVLLIFIGCTGKSAQIPLYTWLPDAMAGPTPVSALIHAATMVTSGVYLLARLNALVTLTYRAMLVIAIIGALTAFFAATIAMVQNDIKKVLAYSTVSQLGYMFLAIGVGSFVGAIFHLMTHAFFKALLFLGSGSVIHSMGGEQDIRKMGGLHKYMPITSITFAVACLAIAGVPLFAGFYSKDLILWGAVSNVHVFQVAGLEGINIAALLAPGIDAASAMPTPESQAAYAAIGAGDPLGMALTSRIVYAIVAFLGFATALMTAFYMWRLYFLTFLGECRADEDTKSHLHESPPTMTIPLVVLAVLSVVGGYTGWPHVIAHWTAIPESVGHSMLAFEHWLEPVFDVSMNTRILNIYGAHPAVPETISMVGSIILAATGIGAAYFFYMKNPHLPKKISERVAKLHTLLSNKYYVDEGYDYVVRGSINFGHAQYLFDRYVIDGLIVNGFGFLAGSLGKALRYLQSGDVQRYATYIVLAVVLALAVLI